MKQFVQGAIAGAVVTAFVLGAAGVYASPEQAVLEGDTWSLVIEPGDGLILERCRPDHPVHPCTTTTGVPTSTTTTSTATTTSSSIPSTTTTSSTPSTTSSSSSLPATSTTSTTSSTTTTLPAPGGFPTLASTGPRVTPTGGPYDDLVTTSNGQVIQGAVITEQLTIRHDNVIVRDSLILGEVTYMIHVTTKADGTCPQNVLIEYTEVDGTNAPGNVYAVRGGAGCGFTFNHGWVHNVGRGVHLTNNASILNSYIDVDRPQVPGDHRNGIMTNGGHNLDIRNNVVYCGGGGGSCSGAISLFGDFAQIDDVLVDHNLMATTGHFCFRGGYEPDQTTGFRFPTNVRVTNNAWSRRFKPLCGISSPMANHDTGVRGNTCVGNVWYETGLPADDWC